MLHNGIRRHRRTESTDNPDQARFECWSFPQAMILAERSRAELLAGASAALTGAPCPGPSRSDAFRLGWELGAVHAKRVPWPRWLTELNAQSADMAAADAAHIAGPVTIH